MDNDALLKEVKIYVTDLLNKGLDSNYMYHCTNHTYNVVRSAEQLAEQGGLKEKDKLVLLVSAWFHDTGYTIGPDNHEENSKKIARDFLQEAKVDEAIINGVEKLIEATKLGVAPAGMLEGLIKDADMCGIAVPNEEYDFGIKLRKEWELTKNKIYTDEEWYKLNYDFFADFDYYTMEGKELFEANKIENVKAIRDKLKEYDIDVLSQKKLNKETKYGRGVETLYRTVCANHIDLSAIADRKANILLSINAIVISIILGSLFNQLQENPLLVGPTTLMIVVCIVTIVLATISTIPKVTEGKSSLEKIRNKQSNLAFFGNFHNMKLKDYVWGMQEMRRDQEFLYDTLTRDIYFLGKVLNKKYKYLRYAYLIFMIGLVISVLFFAVVLATGSTSII